MFKTNLDGCMPFVYEGDYSFYLEKALEAYGILDKETGAGNDFLGWKHLPSQTPESLLKQFEDIRDEWLQAGVDTVVVIGIGGSYLGAKCAIEALSHSFQSRLGRKENSLDVVFAGNNLSEDYLAELLDLPPYTLPLSMLVIGTPAKERPVTPHAVENLVMSERYRRADAATRAAQVAEMDALYRPHATEPGARVRDIYHRKHMSAFMAEMDRSLARWCANWTGEGSLRV